MKKYIFYSILAIATLFVSSCSNDDILIETKGEAFTINYNVNPRPTYETFGISEKVTTNYLRDKVMGIGITTFVYDSNGVLATQEFSVVYAFNSVSQTLKGLEAGHYTIVTVETLVNPDDNYAMDSWEFNGTKNLKDLELVSTDYSMSDVEVVGVSTREVDITKDVTISVEPKAIGSCVYAYFYNFTNSTHDNIGFSTADHISSYKLNPALSRNDRFVTDLTSTGYTNVRGYLSREKTENYHLVMYLLESNIEWKFNFQEKGETSWTYYYANVGNATLEDGKIYYGGFYYYDDSTVPESYFGSASGFSSWLEYARNKQDVTPPTAIYTTPYLNWSVGTVSAVKSYMSSFTLSTDITANSNGGYYMQYRSSDGSTLYEYDFKTQTSGLTDVYVAMDASSVEYSQVESFLKQEGFTLYREDDDSSWFYNSTTGVVVYSQNNLIIVNYYDTSAYSSAPQRIKTEMNRPFLSRHTNILQTQSEYGNAMFRKEVVRALN